MQTVEHLHQAVAHLTKNDSRLAALIAQHPELPVRLLSQPQQTCFDALIKSIIYQQLSMRAAGTIHERVLRFLVGPPAQALAPSTPTKPAGKRRRASDVAVVEAAAAGVPAALPSKSGTAGRAGSAATLQAQHQLRSDQAVAPAPACSTPAEAVGASRSTAAGSAAAATAILSSAAATPVRQSGRKRRALGNESNTPVVDAKSAGAATGAVMAAGGRPAPAPTPAPAPAPSTLRPLVPSDILNCNQEGLRQAGLSRQKVSYVWGIAQAFAAASAQAAEGKQVLLQEEVLRALPEEQLTAALVELKGVGQWTADMVAMFTLGKPNILPTGDLGIKKGMQALYGLKNLPSPSEMAAIASSWQPWQSVGCWFLWKLAPGGGVW